VEARVVGGGQLARNMTAHAFHPIPKILHISSLISPLSLMLCLVSDEARCAEATVRHLKFRTLGGAWRIVFPALKHAFPLWVQVSVSHEIEAAGWVGCADNFPKTPKTAKKYLNEHWLVFVNFFPFWGILQCSLRLATTLHTY